MMFLQYAIWGAWFAVLSAYLESDLGFTGVQIGAIYSLLPLGLIIAPFIGGQLADRSRSLPQPLENLARVGSAKAVRVSW